MAKKKHKKDPGKKQKGAWRPLELCYWPDQGALPAKGKEYPGLGYKRGTAVVENTVVGTIQGFSNTIQAERPCWGVHQVAMPPECRQPE
ncbi:hypothetical protein HaLaN_18476 [Haematococcus lacustris]|uniref:Uncharacterized protein n=1 Tax=Haematococcus lacustris TaxID=44745 RepID=A0A699ZS36_HAELA|nr:hypothetical protein HaLaN_18476 [Haematococcus lacustris]